MSPTIRKEIEGLKAIAVCAIIFYHTQTTFFGNIFFKGGYIGVDIFFVVSGYLITLSILRELLRSGTLSFKYFFFKRINRILPSLILVLIISFPFAWIYLFPSDFVLYSK